MSEFSPVAMVKALNDFKSEAFVKSLNKRISEVVTQQNIGTCDVIDVQPVIRKVLFDVIYGKAPDNETDLFNGNVTICCWLIQFALIGTFPNWNSKLWQTALNQITIL